MEQKISMEEIYTYICVCSSMCGCVYIYVCIDGWRVALVTFAGGLFVSLVEMWRICWLSIPLWFAPSPRGDGKMDDAGRAAGWVRGDLREEGGARRSPLGDEWKVKRKLGTRSLDAKERSIAGCLLLLLPETNQLCEVYRLCCSSKLFLCFLRPKP